jgi:hypothetical protein
MYQSNYRNVISSACLAKNASPYLLSKFRCFNVCLKRRLLGNPNERRVVGLLKQRHHTQKYDSPPFNGMFTQAKNGNKRFY